MIGRLLEWLRCRRRPTHPPQDEWSEYLLEQGLRDPGIVEKRWPR